MHQSRAHRGSRREHGRGSAQDPPRRPSPAQGSRPKSAAAPRPAPPPPPLATRPGEQGLFGGGQRSARSARGAAGRGGAPRSAGEAPRSAADIRSRLIELYQASDPANIDKVDYLLQKYDGKEELLYQQACSKYRKADSGASSASGAGAAPPVATRAKAVLPKPRTLPKPRMLPKPLGGAGQAPGRSSAAAGAANGFAAAAAGGSLRAHGGPASPASALLASIDLVLLGARSGFFDAAAAESSGSDLSSESASESASESESASSPKDDAGAPSEAPGEAPGDPREAASARAPGAGRVVRQARANGAAPAATPKTQPEGALPKGVRGAPPALPAKRQGAAAVRPPAPAERPPVARPPAAPPPPRRPAPPPRADAGKEADDDLEDDDALAAALRASMRQAVEDAAAARRPPPAPAAPASRPKAGASGAQNAQATRPKSAAWGAPPPLRGKQAARQGPRLAEAAEVSSSVGAKPKAPPAAREPPAPPLFEQWLASLKFLTGWNDQKTHTHVEVTSAFKEHLNEEGIETKKTIEQLCSTVVPLVLALPKTDAAVVKNLRGDVLRGCKMVQVSILRLVTFELCREREAKELQKRNGGLAKDGGPAAAERPEPPKSAPPHLASNIDSLAKVLRHFRLDRKFNEGLHQLILSIRGFKVKNKPGQKEARQGRRRDGDGGKADKKASARKRRAQDASRSRDGGEALRPPRQRPRREP